LNAARIRILPLSRLYLAAGLAATGLYFLLPWNSRGQLLLYDLVGAASGVAVIVGVRINKPSLPASWYLFAGGLVAFATGDLIFNLYDWVGHRSPPIPSLADVFYLAGYPFLTVGIVLLVLRMRSEERRAGLVDATLVATAFGVCQWVFVMHPLVSGSGQWTENAVVLAYPAMDVLLLTGLLFLALTPAWRTVAYRYLAASIVLLVVVDEIYALSPESFPGTSFLDAGWLLSYVLWGVAALSPSMRELSEPTSPPSARLTRSRVAVLSAAILTAPVALVIERSLGRPIDAVAIAIGAAALSGLVLIRLAGFIKSLDRLHEAERSARAEAVAMHQELARKNEQLLEADRLKDEFVALISHDLRTPLTSIIGYLELTLDDGNLSEEQRGYLAVADRNADRLLHLVNDLLFVARLEAGELNLQPSELDLAALARQSVSEAGPRASAGGVELTFETDGAVPVQADKGRMFQVLDNLVSNAIKFTPAGGGVKVSVGPANGVVRLQVSDTGIGIEPAEQGRLFERFFRTATVAEQQIPGTGLGLYIARVIVEAHGGSIEVQSRPGEGSSFCVELPSGALA
jgi:signal transduction histidine kinase